MRPYLTVALLLVASIGAQAAEPQHGGPGRTVPGLLAALMDQPAGILSASQLSAPTAAQLLLGSLGQAAPAISPARHEAPSLMPAVAVSRSVQASVHSYALTSQITRGP